MFWALDKELINLLFTLWIFQQPLQHRGDDRETDRTLQRSQPGAHLKPGSHRSRHLEHDGIDNDQEESQSQDRDGESKDLQQKPQGGIDESKDQCGEQGRPEISYDKSRHQLADNQQRNRVDQPLNQQFHVSSLLTGQGALSQIVEMKEVLDQFRSTFRGSEIGKGGVRFTKPEKIDFEVIMQLLIASANSKS